MSVSHTGTAENGCIGFWWSKFRSEFRLIRRSARPPGT